MWASWTEHESSGEPFMFGICFSSCGFGFTCQIQKRWKTKGKKCNEFVKKE